ncbi:hypothetical protein K503DRAFT_784864 [Rhizopogon vinicolor AM-OR11-026]|uniref:Uncharacterized protein n=1 Tax=Rhizopogon vinicolor AM-OR11-026 TaxID=1314800 RepID=A0A1B7MT38_9AGAM|nr:hypothetical protein K503DRAFT_784864 [Rhizopogon vinicolor AM-OR11-026]
MRTDQIAAGPADPFFTLETNPGTRCNATARPSRTVARLSTSFRSSNSNTRQPAIPLQCHELQPKKKLPWYYPDPFTLQARDQNFQPQALLWHHVPVPLLTYFSLHGTKGLTVRDHFESGSSNSKILVRYAATVDVAPHHPLTPPENQSQSDLKRNTRQQFSMDQVTFTLSTPERNPVTFLLVPVLSMLLALLGASKRLPVPQMAEQSAVPYHNPLPRYKKRPV